LDHEGKVRHHVHSITQIFFEDEELAKREVAWIFGHSDLVHFSAVSRAFVMVCYCYMQEDLSCVLGWDLCVTSLYHDRHPVHLFIGSIELDRSTATRTNVRGANRPYTGRLDFEVVRDQPRAVPARGTRIDQKGWQLEDNTGDIGHHIWLDQNRIITFFGKLALNT
jgi:hypothetical protein